MFQSLRTMIYLALTKCTEGIYCQRKDCVCLHPNQPEHDIGMLKQINIPCNTPNCTRKHNDDVSGYCPYLHVSE